MNNIYIILYHEFALADCYHTDVDGSYFTNKDEAVKHLESKGYNHLCDDEYEKRFMKAEIIGLSKMEDTNNG
ncbi:hypothetical protein [Staphylococcus simulans]|uniref:hypothetical protein n=1 Tax=Staphylococcus simulans TaxID=1286 RepID=UPI0021D1426B|nr:hypothetical protein [Staphylococcus simulans]UXR50997.1 hypothetical protein MUA28_05490 [Staphylococcus simulans]